MKKLLILFTMFAVLFAFCSCGKSTPLVKIEDVDSKSSLEDIKTTDEPVEDSKEYKVEEDGFRHVESPSLNLEYIGDAVANNYNSATLKGIEFKDYSIDALVDTTMEIADIYYEIYNEDKSEVLYSGSNRLSYGKSTGTEYQITINTEKAEDIDEDNLELLTNNNLPIKLFIESGLDSEILINLR